MCLSLVDTALNNKLLQSSSSADVGPFRRQPICPSVSSEFVTVSGSTEHKHVKIYLVNIFFEIKNDTFIDP